MLLALMLLLGAAEPRPVALLPLRTLGVSPDVMSALAVTLRNEVAELPEAKLISDKDLAVHLAREADCAEKPSCAAAAASRSGARQLIVGTVSQLGDSYMIDLKLLDARSARELRRATRPVTGSRDALIEGLRQSAVELLAPARFTGGLQVEVDVPGATVFLDGKQVGTAPMKHAIEGLAPGQHTLRVVDRGREISTFVEVRYGEVSRARIEFGQAKREKSEIWLPSSGVLASGRCPTRAPSPA